MPQTRIVIDIDEDLAASLEAATKRSQPSVESFTASAVARAIADVEAWAEEEAAYAEYERTGEAIPLAAMSSGSGAGAWRTSCLHQSRANRLPEPPLEIFHLSITIRGAARPVLLS